MEYWNIHVWIGLVHLELVKHDAMNNVLAILERLDTKAMKIMAVEDTERLNQSALLLLPTMDSYQLNPSIPQLSF